MPVQQMNYSQYRAFADDEFVNREVDVVRLRIPELDSNGAVVAGQDEFDRSLQEDQRVFIRGGSIVGPIDLETPHDIQVKVQDLISVAGLTNDVSPWLQPNEVGGWIATQRARPHPQVG